MAQQFLAIYAKENAGWVFGSLRGSVGDIVTVQLWQDAKRHVWQPIALPGAAVVRLKAPSSLFSLKLGSP